MTRAKILIGLGTLACTMATIISPAGAWIESTTGTAKGPVAKFPASSLLTATNGTTTAEVKCESTTATKATAFWVIQTSEETVSGGVQSQPITKQGPHDDLVIQLWGTCSATLAGTTLAATVSECTLQDVQIEKSTAAGQSTTGSIGTNCVVKIPAATCTLTVPQITSNLRLKTIVATNSASGIELKANISGITYKATAGCVGLSGEHTGATFKTGVSGSEAIITAAQKLV